MPIEKLTLTVYTILIFHIPCIIFVSFFALYFAYKTPKNETSLCFLGIMLALLIWIVAKVFKTLSPTLFLRWTFVVIQYIGVYSLSFLLLRFGYLYSKNRTPPKTLTIVTLVLSLLNFFIVITNPIHMLFYKHFDLYYDRFGSLFMPTQIIQYAMIFYAIILLVSGYKDNSVTYSKKLTGYCLSFFMIAPLVINVYYLLFKLVDLPWILPFAVFDITPISISIALVFFIIPALKMRFLNLRQFANDHIFNRLSQGIISFSKRGYLQYYNYFCASRFPNSITKKDLKSFLKSIDATLSVPITTKGEIFSLNNKTYYLCGNDSSKKFYYLFIYDVTMLVENKKSLEQKLHTLQMIQSHLKSHATAKLNSEISKLKSTFAQDIHDIIGHSLTVFLASKESLISHTQISKLKSELKILENLFNDSIISINGKTPSLIIKEGDTSLESMFNSLETPAIKVHFLSEGKTLFLDRNTKKTLLRVAQESITNAIKHGNAKNIFIVIHYHDTYMKCLIHDDGLGCPHISPNMGLQGIQSQISKLHGFVSFGSDAQKGFYTDITFPI